VKTLGRNPKPLSSNDNPLSDRSGINAKGPAATAIAPDRDSTIPHEETKMNEIRDNTAATVVPAPLLEGRSRIEAKIEELISLLDLVDGDENLEPYLADTRGLISGSADDREGDDADYEPSLGSAERHPNALSWGDEPVRHSQERWSGGGMDELEDDGDDLEPDNDAEPTMAWANEGNQEQLGHGMAFANDENEPELGWCGHGRGWTPNEGCEDTEPNGDEVDFNGDEGDHSVGLIMGGCGL
jgi:hypothetical protein